jgi:hypothetical protein
MANFLTEIAIGLWFPPVDRGEHSAFFYFITRCLLTNSSTFDHSELNETLGIMIKSFFHSSLIFEK